MTSTLYVYMRTAIAAQSVSATTWSDPNTRSTFYGMFSI